MYKSVQYTDDGKLVLELPDDFAKKPLEIYIFQRDDKDLSIDSEEININKVS